jgi:hypothetical protein
MRVMIDDLAGGTLRPVTWNLFVYAPRTNP